VEKREKAYLNCQRKILMSSDVRKKRTARCREAASGSCPGNFRTEEIKIEETLLWGEARSLRGGEKFLKGRRLIRCDYWSLLIFGGGFIDLKPIPKGSCFVEEGSVGDCGDPRH